MLMANLEVFKHTHTTTTPTPQPPHTPHAMAEGKPKVSTQPCSAKDQLCVTPVIRHVLNTLLCTSLDWEIAEIGPCYIRAPSTNSSHSQAGSSGTAFTENVFPYSTPNHPTNPGIQPLPAAAFPTKDSRIAQPESSAGV